MTNNYYKFFIKIVFKIDKRSIELLIGQAYKCQEEKQKKCKKRVNLSDVYKKTGGIIRRNKKIKRTYKPVDNVDKSVYKLKTTKIKGKCGGDNFGRNVCG